MCDLTYSSPSPTALAFPSSAPVSLSNARKIITLEFQNNDCRKYLTYANEVLKPGSTIQSIDKMVSIRIVSVCLHLFVLLHTARPVLMCPFNADASCRTSSRSLDRVGVFGIRGVLQHCVDCLDVVVHTHRSHLDYRKACALVEI